LSPTAQTATAAAAAAQVTTAVAVRGDLKPAAAPLPPAAPARTILNENIVCAIPCRLGGAAARRCRLLHRSTPAHHYRPTATATAPAARQEAATSDVASLAMTTRGRWTQSSRSWRGSSRPRRACRQTMRGSPRGRRRRQVSATRGPSWSGFARARGSRLRHCRHCRARCRQVGGDRVPRRPRVAGGAGHPHRRRIGVAAPRRRRRHYHHGALRRHLHANAGARRRHDVTMSTHRRGADSDLLCHSTG